MKHTHTHTHTDSRPHTGCFKQRHCPGVIENAGQESDGPNSRTGKLQDRAKAVRRGRTAFGRSCSFFRCCYLVGDFPVLDFQQPAVWLTDRERQSV